VAIAKGELSRVAERQSIVPFIRGMESLNAESYNYMVLVVEKMEERDVVNVAAHALVDK
jgi:hypothetical protein